VALGYNSSSFPVRERDQAVDPWIVANGRNLWTTAADASRISRLSN
jgi:hypothetical protein